MHALGPSHQPPPTSSNFATAAYRLKNSGAAHFFLAQLKIVMLIS
jgi:hypothetical protein